MPHDGSGHPEPCSIVIEHARQPLRAVCFTKQTSDTVCCVSRAASRRNAVQVKALLGGGGEGKKGPLGGLGDMANIMENMKKAQSMVQTEAAQIQAELAACASLPATGTCHVA